MKFIGVVLRSLNCVLSPQFKQTHMARTISTSLISANAADEKSSNASFESADDFEQRIFGGPSDTNPKTDSFFQKLERLEKARGRSGFGSRQNGSNNSQFLDGLNESLNTLSDGMDGKLKKAATYFEFNPDEIDKDEYAFRPDVSFKPGMTYELKDLDLTRPRAPKPFTRPEFKPTTEEVLRKADFRNVRFLANFITEAGIIIKRKSTGISAKAQRKVAREIKTARAFGLMPFTSMGTKSFVFGRTMEDRDEDYQFDDYDAPVFVRDPL